MLRQITNIPQWSVRFDQVLSRIKKREAPSKRTAQGVLLIVQGRNEAGARMECRDVLFCTRQGQQTRQYGQNLSSYTGDGNGLNGLIISFFGKG